jgi:hypothetical protein
MKIGTAFAMALVVGVSASVGVSSKVYAVNLNIPGSACRNFNAAEATDIDYFGIGVRNVNASTRTVVCPVVRSPTSTNTVSVFVDGMASSNTTISCALSSFNFDDTFLGSQSFPAPLTGRFDQALNVPGAFWSNAIVICDLPGRENGSIYDIDVVQN